jgi:hypothetical protein
MAGFRPTRAAILAAALGAAGALPHPARAGDDLAAKGAATEAPSAAAPETRPAPDAAARRWARALWFDLRGRGPTAAELRASLALEPAALVDRFLADPATWEAWLDRELYYFLLIDRFRPVSERVVALPPRLASGEANAKDALREIVVSAEFNARNPGNDTFVSVVLEQLLGTVVQKEKRVLEAGKKMYDGYATRLFGELGRNQSDVVRIVLAQRECADLFVARQRRRVFGREAAREEVDRDGARLHADPAAFPGLLREWVLSDAYRARTAIPRPKDDTTFLRTLFSDLLGREPTFEEFRNSRNAFLALSDPAPIRNVIAQLLLDSGRAEVPRKEDLGKPGDWVREQFLRLLGRPATDRETEAFVAALGEYGCEPSTLLLAIVTSPEYQYY